MLELYKNIKERRNALEMSQDTLASLTGYKDRSSIAKIERGVVDIPESKIREFAKALRTTPSELLGFDGIEPTQLDLTYSIPVLGRVAAGYGKEAVEEIIGSIEVSPALKRRGELFALLIKGDSMVPELRDGDTVVVQKTDEADTGDLVIALVNGSDATCKRLQRYAEGLALLPTNPAYEPMRFSQSEIDTMPVRILGKVIQLIRNF